MKKGFLQFFLPTILAANSAFGYTVEDQIKDAVKDTISSTIQSNFPEAKVKLDFNSISNKYGFNICEEKLIVKSPSHIYKNFTVRVTCPQEENSWSIGITGQTTQILPVIVSNSSYRRGEKIKLTTLSIEERDISNLRGRFLTNLNVLKDSKASKNISVGEILNKTDIKYSELVNKKDKVLINYRKNGIKIIYYGIAKEKGMLGDYIKIENPNTGKVIIGKVSGNKEVLIN